MPRLPSLAVPGVSHHVEETEVGRSGSLRGSLQVPGFESPVGRFPLTSILGEAGAAPGEEAEVLRGGDACPGVAGWKEQQRGPWVLPTHARLKPGV